jgi:hypothetical protein
VRRPPAEREACGALAIGAIVDAPVFVLGDLGGRVVGVFERIGDIWVYWLGSCSRWR